MGADLTSGGKIFQRAGATVFFNKKKMDYVVDFISVQRQTSEEKFSKQPQLERKGLS